MHGNAAIINSILITDKLQSWITFTISVSRPMLELEVIPQNNDKHIIGHCLRHIALIGTLRISYRQRMLPVTQ